VPVGLAVVLRLPFLLEPLRPDEAGYLMVAQQWHLSDSTTYGSYWVDRPPLLLLIFKAAVGQGPLGIRLVGTVAAAALVAAAAAVGQAVAGRRAAWWSSLVTAALVSSFALGGQEVDGELLAAPFVLAGCAATLWAVDERQTRVGRLVLGFLAGVAAVAAVLVKQNFVDALAFAGVLLVLMARNPATRRRALETAVAGAAGVALVLAAVLVWAATVGPGVGDLFYVMYLFRFDAAEVIARRDLARPEARLLGLVAVALVSGLVPLLSAALWQALGPRRRRDPLAWALAAMVAVGGVGVAAGASYWRHYLIELVPAAAIGTAMLARGRPTRWVRPLVSLVVVSSAVAMFVGGGIHQIAGDPEEAATRMARWLEARSAPGDTAVITYGHANVLLPAGLSSPYPYLWSLPARVRDPNLKLLVSTVEGPRAPTWIVEWNSFDSWGLDADRRLAQAVFENYHMVAVVAGHNVYRLDRRP
jgi:4-amino-4-deoxy-L-arabinose transferase-like glycosyltransferase